MIVQSVRQTPQAIVENNRIHSGFFKLPFRNVNMLDDKSICSSIAKPLRRLRLKEWVGFGFSHPDLYGAMIIQDAKIAASGTVYLFNKNSRNFLEWLLIDLPGHVKLPETLWQGESRCGFASKYMSFEHRLDDCRHKVRVELPVGRGKPSLSVDLVLHQNYRQTDPLVVSLPIGTEHHTYTHKAPMQMEGKIIVGDKEYLFEPSRDLANLDEQKTFYPYRSNWKWGCFAVNTDKGHEVAVNFVNQMTPLDEPGEDAMWVDGRLSLLGRPQIIELSKDGRYRIEDPEGRMELTFTPVGSKKERRNFGLIFMDYEQFFGLYDGKVIDHDGKAHLIEKAYGALERMVARF